MPGGRRERSGRKPTPRHLRILRGNPGKRPLHPEPAEQEVSKGQCPAWLDRHGREFWRMIAPRLLATKCLPYVSEPILAMLANEWSVYRRATAKLKRDLTHETKSNGSSARPEVGIRKSAADLIRALAPEFGMTPASMTRLAEAGLSGHRDTSEDFFTRPRTPSA